MADKNNHSNDSDTLRIPKKNVTGGYPGVTGTYKPHSSFSEMNSAPTGSMGGRKMPPSRPVDARSQTVRNSKETVKEEPEPKKGFDFRLWFSKENNKAFLRQLRYYGLIVLAAILLTFGIVNVSNDVFAFIKPDESIVVTIEQGGGSGAVAKALKKAGVIDHPLIFRLYSKLKKADGKFQYGDYTLNSNLDYDQIISAQKAVGAG